MKQYIHPPVEQEKMNQIFTSITKVDKKCRMIHVDNTVNLPIIIIEVYISIFILYDWTMNEILAAPIKDTKYETTIEAFQTHIRYIAKRIFKHIFIVIDNVASKATKIYLQEENIQMQLVEPHNHEVNSAEREIHTFKNHLIAGISIWYENFPTILWSYLISQAQYPINLLRTSQVHPQLSE